MAGSSYFQKTLKGDGGHIRTLAMHRLCTGYAQAMHRRHTTLLLPERLPTTLLLPEGCPMGGTFILLLSEWCAFPEDNGFDPVRKSMIPFLPEGRRFLWAGAPGRSATKFGVGGMRRQPTKNDLSGGEGFSRRTGYAPIIPILVSPTRLKGQHI